VSDPTVDLRRKLQALAEDYELACNENGDLSRENARLKGQIEVLREHVPAPYEVRCPDCNALVATEYGENATMARRDSVIFPCRSCSERRYRPEELPPCAVGACHRIDCNLCVERCSETMHAPNCEHRVCRKTRTEDCWCGWRREFGERWEDHFPLNGFHKEERETEGRDDA